MFLFSLGPPLSVETDAKYNRWRFVWDSKFCSFTPQLSDQSGALLQFDFAIINCLLCSSFFALIFITFFQSSYVDVQDEVTDLRDEDIIEAVPGTTVVMTSAGHPSVHSRTTTSNVDVVAAAVNEAIKDIEYEAAAASAEVIFFYN